MNYIINSMAYWECLANHSEIEIAIDSLKGPTLKKNIHNLK